MAPRFEDIPAELLVSITSHLSTPDYGSVRLTCTMVEKKLFDSWAKEFFTRKQFMLTRSSLQALIDISNHQTLGRYLKKVIIGTNIIPYLHKPSFTTSIGVPPNTDNQTIEWLREQYLDQCYLIDRGLDTSMLAEALSNLPACREIEIRDFDSRKRGRDTGNWTSYGATELARRSRRATVFSVPQNPQLSHKWTHHVFRAVTTAMTRSKINSYMSLLVTTRLPLNDLDEDAFYVPSSDKAQFAEAFQSITTLMLPLHTAQNPPSTFQFDSSVKQAPMLTDFQSFLSHFPNLSWLRLNCVHVDPSIGSEWLGVAKSALASCPLRRLDFGKVNITSTLLQEFVYTFKGLEQLVLYRLTLMDGAWVDLLDHLNQELPMLRSIEFNLLKAGKRPDSLYRNFVNWHVGFKSSIEAKATLPTDLKPMISFKGDWLNEVKGRLVVQDEEFLHPENSGSDSSGNESDSDEENEVFDADMPDDDEDDDMGMDDEE